MDEVKQTRFIAVVHKWFVVCKGWHVEYLKATNRQEANIEAAVLYRRHNSNFTNAEVMVIELQSGEHLIRNRPPGQSLTLWERITGRVSSKPTSPNTTDANEKGGE